MIAPDVRTVEDFDVEAGGGTIRVHRFGSPGGRLVVCVHGISANSRWFDYLAERLVSTDRTIAAIDLRGRGRSATTAPGSYGLRNHALDVFAVAKALGATTFDYVGHSMGAYVGMEAGIVRDDVRLRRAVLVDGLGIPRYAALASIRRVLDRLERTFESPEAYVAYVRGLDLVPRWNAYWQRAYEYEILVSDDGSVRSRTQRAPVLEDISYGRAHDARRLWRELDLPVLALRASRPLDGRSGHVVPAFDLQNFARIAPRATVSTIDANHYDIMMHEDTLTSIRGFLDAA